MTDLLVPAAKIREAHTPPVACASLGTPLGRGYCKCGCGQKTTVSDRTHRKYGWVKDEPKPYVFGHQRVKRNHWLVDWDTGCWIYQTVNRHQRYASIERVEGGKRRKILVHRENYKRKHGPIPDGMELDHLCRNTHCVNPDHLEPVTHAENMRRWGESRRD